jgi:hypothetical protein
MFSFGGDPYLTGEGAFETITGIQSQGVQAVAKHLINKSDNFFSRLLFTEMCFAVSKNTPGLRSHLMLTIGKLSYFHYTVLKTQLPSLQNGVLNLC